MKILFTATFLAFTLIYTANASDSPRVDSDIKVYDDTVATMNATFEQKPANPNNTEWVKLKIQHMVDVDQYTRHYSDTPFNHQYSASEKAAWQLQFGPRFSAIDQADTVDLKSLLKIYSWFTISRFDAQTDFNAWLLVQHADLDPAFQKQVLVILEQLYPTGETSPKDYAYLFDRVAASWSVPILRVLQRYGTQGICTGPSTWQPIAMEDPIHIDERRATVRLGPEADYMKMFKDICH